MKSVNTSLLRKNSIVAVALSGGSDSVALCHFLKKNEEKLNIVVKALNVEHGIRGLDSLSDTAFVKDFCNNLNVPLLTYSVDATQYAKTNKLSLEESARILRYNCFFDAIENGACDVIATAHHKKDNFESVLFNLFRGTGLKGLSGIQDDFDGKIIRPMLGVSKDEINEYIEKNTLAFVTDKSNYDTDFTRNALRHKVIPEIEKIFEGAEDAVYRFSQIAKAEDEFLDSLASKNVSFVDGLAKISLDTPDPLFSRAVIIALKGVGVKKDWGKTHIDSVRELKTLENGAKINLLNGFSAFKEYDGIVIAKDFSVFDGSIPFGVGKLSFNSDKIRVDIVDSVKDFKNGLYADLDKIPNKAIIRTKRDGDTFTKFGGGTKSLGDYLTDKKIPLRLRHSLPVIADGTDVLAIFGVEISDKIKVDKTTKNIIKITRENHNET